MKIKTTIVLAALLCGLLMVGGGVWAMSSGNYAINWDVIGGGGEPASSANYAIKSTIGQAIAEKSSSSNYELGSGYWHPVGPTVAPGDANGDGVVNVLDLAFTARIIAVLEPNGDLHPGADANQDGVVNVLDLAQIARIIAGLA